MFTIGTIISAVCSPFIGKLFTKVNVKVLYIIASILVGVGFMAFAFAAFCIPNNIAPGGFSGLATVLYSFTGAPVGVSSFVMCIPLFII